MLMPVLGSLNLENVSGVTLTNSAGAHKIVLLCCHSY